MALTYAITAFKDANTMTATDATIAKHVHDALVTFEEKVFKPHLSKEDEDWNALKVKASRAMPLVAVINPEDGPVMIAGWRSYKTSDERSNKRESLAWKKNPDGGFVAEYITGETIDSDGTTHTGSGEDPFTAMAKAVASSGASLETFDPMNMRAL